MKKLLRSLAATLCAFAFTMSSYAQHEIKFGYCNDSLSARAEVIGNTSSQSDLSFRAAICIPGARLQMLKGSTIKRMRFCTDGQLNKIYAWVRNDINGTALTSVKVGTTQTGWNEVTFTKPVEITGNNLYVGFSGNVPYGMGIVCDGTRNSNGSYFYDGSQWIDLSTSANGSYRPFCIQVFAEVDSDAPIEDVAIEKIEFENTYTKVGDKALATVSIGNYGETSVNVPRLFYTLGSNTTPIEVPTSGTVKANNSVSFDTEIATDGLEDGKNPIQFFIETNDNYKGNDTLSAEVLCYSTAYPHKVLVEHFTTLPCVNCPYGLATLNTLLNNRNDYVWIAHHIGYNTDELTEQASYTLEGFGVTQAPLAMFDRRVLPVSNSTSYPVIGIGYSNAANGAKTLKPSFDLCANTPAFVSVNIENQYDPTTRTLTTTVSGERNALFETFYDDTYLTVELMEDNVTTQKGQTGSGSTTHNHVFRKALSRTSGNLMEWDGDTYSKTFTTEIPSTWNDQKVSVVAFVNQAITNVTDAEVLNANSLNINHTTAVSNATANGAQVLSRTFYNVQGQRINAPLTQGAYIERIETTEGTKVVKKLR